MARQNIGGYRCASPNLQKTDRTLMSLPSSINDLAALLTQHDYLADRPLATTLFLALKLGRPLLLEGEAGVGKTELAKTLAHALSRPLIRLQCHEGLDISQAAYEWNYPRQLMEIRLAEASGQTDKATLGQSIYREDFLIKRPLLQALQGAPGAAPVLLIDELDRADEPFEAYLLEVLSDFQVTIPELGTVVAVERPIVIITSNRTREIHDALRRRCLYHWTAYPDAARELAILRRKVPAAPAALAAQVVAFAQKIRGLDVYKAPGIAETIDWCEALMALDATALDPETVSDTLGVLMKYQDDVSMLNKERIGELLADGVSG
jgi:MoxR-like ATPase